VDYRNRYAAGLSRHCLCRPGRQLRTRRRVFSMTPTFLTLSETALRLFGSPHWRARKRTKELVEAGELNPVELTNRLYFNPAEISQYKEERHGM